MQDNCLVWNVRGLNNPTRRKVVRDMVVQNNISLVCLQETKLASVDLGIVHQCCAGDFFEFVYSPTQGTRGGVLLAWKGEQLLLPNVLVQESFVAAHGRTVGGLPIGIFTVYGPQDTNDKLLFLNDLEHAVQTFIPAGTTLALTDDFNLIANVADKNNSRIDRRCLGAFRRFINVLQLKDLYLHGWHFTWSNEQANAMMVKLDRVLVTEDSDAKFPSCLLQALSSEMSDHCPRLLSYDAAFKHSRAFKF